ncbi:hypothetical protein [Streptomyces sp. KL116D]|uniref:hypothetical protein n=1 Tax=Streptomyces sp. KL116D TaxID=3045152 RepID=UPI0035590FD1
MDCLFLSEGGPAARATGALLMAAVAAEAHALGLDEIQWRTPTWNEGARASTTASAPHARKLRYTMSSALTDR